MNAVGDQFTHDLAANARLHILFLRTVHAAGVSLNRPTPTQVRRYRDLWLPLVAKNIEEGTGSGDVTAEEGDGGGGLIPPIDIAWLWHCHRLAPYDYAQHVRERFGRAGDAHSKSCPLYLDADPPFALQHRDQDESKLSAAALTTRRIWRELYPREPFFLLENQNDDRHEIAENEEDRNKGGTLSGFDLLGSAERQATFLWQVEQRRFRDESFLLQGVQNYYKFLKLRSAEERGGGGKKKNQIIVPTYQIDLIWHTHILSSLRAYDADCRSILGDTLHHDDSLNDRTVGATLDVAFRATKDLWTEEWGTDYVVPGGMYRGEPLEEYYSQEWSARQMDDDAAGCLLIPVDGRIMGASSTMTKESGVGVGSGSGSIPVAEVVTEMTTMTAPPSDVSRPTPRWLEPHGTAPDGKPGFVPAADRSRTRGVNNNPKSEEYIFGSGPLGHGYYHILTKDAYVILRGRVVKKIEAKMTEANCLSCFACVCPCGGGRALEAKVREEIVDLVEVRAVLDGRIRADVPVGVVGVRDTVPRGANRYYDDSGAWLFPVCFYNAGGGCGGVIDDMGWGGGGGCGGGGACGGGGCGGGGCGGGGCGGGGCGG